MQLETVFQPLMGIQSLGPYYSWSKVKLQNTYSVGVKSLVPVNALYGASLGCTTCSHEHNPYLLGEENVKMRGRC